MIDLKIGYAITGSFCTFSRTKQVMKELVSEGHELTPILSENAKSFDTRFGKALQQCQEIEEICGKEIWDTIPIVEPIGPKGLFDVMVIAPCTGNTLAKLASGITDTAVLMAAKAHLRQMRPLVIAISSNDAMGQNFTNIGELFKTKNIYFVPFSQDDYKKKPASLVAHFDLIGKTIEEAVEGRQIQPVLKVLS